MTKLGEAVTDLQTDYFCDRVQNHENENVRYIGQGEAPHRKYKRLKLGGGHVYGCSSV
jgi:hypothetical protein